MISDLNMFVYVCKQVIKTIDVYKVPSNTLFLDGLLYFLQVCKRVYRSLHMVVGCIHVFFVHQV